MKNSTWLLDHAANTYSQCGEDGIISTVLAMLPEKDQWCVEFGAWDGAHLSNVRKLILEQNYRAVLIEGDPARCGQILTNYSEPSHSDHVHPVNAFVGFDASDGLDKLLSGHEIPVNFDFLSVDIDGNDYHVWEAVESYRPKVVCIEFNPTIPTEVDFVQEKNPEVNQGCSLRALYRLAKIKGYEAICVMPWNVIFVDGMYFDRFQIGDNSAASLRRDLSLVTWIFSGYDGSVHLSGAKQLPWHNLPLDESNLKQVPALLRAYPHNYSDAQRLLFSLLKTMRRFSGRSRH